MLDDPQGAREALDEFVGQWLRFDRLLTASKDRRNFPQFTPRDRRRDDRRRRAASSATWSGTTAISWTLFTADYGFLNGDLAAIYGVEPPAKDFDRVAFPADSERAGLLGQALFLTLTAKPDETSPTARGLFVREQFLCQHVPDPPPGVNTNLPPVTRGQAADQSRTHGRCTPPTKLRHLPQADRPDRLRLREVRRHRRSGATSSSCTFGQSFGGEQGGAAAHGHHRGTRSRHHGPGRRHSRTRSSPSPTELGAVLAESAQCQECMVKQYFRYMAGRTETPADRPLIRKVLEDFRQSGFHFKEMIISLVRAREFPEHRRGCQCRR